MKRLLATLVVLGALAVTTTAAAHPLGNFTVNRFGEVDVSGNRVFVRYVLDMAEIPTFQARQAGGVDARSYARRIASGLALAVDGRRVALRPVREALAFPKGAGGLRTTRLEVILSGPTLAGRARLSLRDRNFAGRLGWKEVVVAGSEGARVLRSSAPATSASDRLRAYPKDLLSSPLDVTSARAVVEPGPTAGPVPALSRGRALRAPDRVADGGFASLVGRDHLSVLVVLASLGVALFWGAAHALSPGHGKSIVAAYLVGQRGTARHAAYLGAIVTVTHTIGVFALGAVTLLLSELVVPERLYPWLNLATGLMVVAIGFSVLRLRLRHQLAHWLGRDHEHDDDDHHHHHHHHNHGHEHGHSHAAPEGLGWRSLLAVGVSGGLLPCPSALVVLLAAISLHRVAFGLVLIVAFSLGLALTVTGIGLVAVYAKRAFGRIRLDGRLVGLLPAASAVVILVAGVVMTARALPKVS